MASSVALLVDYKLHFWILHIPRADDVITSHSVLEEHLTSSKSLPVLKMKLSANLESTPRN
jgi:hypothetical protein